MTDPNKPNFGTYFEHENFLKNVYKGGFNTQEETEVSNYKYEEPLSLPINKY